MGTAPEAVTWLGHATTLLELGGARAVTDPVLRDRVGHLRRVGARTEAPEGVDVILVSHLHRDHLDRLSLRRLDRRVPVVGPRGLARVLAGRRSSVHELAPGERIVVGAMEIRAVPAVHQVQRTPLGPRTPALGFVVSGRASAYFAGDTEVFDGMAEVARPTVALVPVAGWGPRVGAGHMGPLDAARAVALIRPGIAVPIHWGTLQAVAARRGPGPSTPAEEFAAAVGRLAPGTRARILRPGERLALAPEVRPS